MICAIHQPNFFPWLGYFYKIWKADHFVFLDDVQFSKGSYTKRVLLNDASNKRRYFLHCAIHKPTSTDKICDLIVKSEESERLIKSAIFNHYSGYPYYKESEKILDDIFKMFSPEISLAEFNIKSIQLLAKHLGFETLFYRSSEIGKSGLKDDRLIKIIQSLHCNTYITGKGANSYLDFSKFEEELISVKIHDFYSFQTNQPYTQIGSQFIPGLSILDALFNIGTKATRTYIQDYSA